MLSKEEYLKYIVDCLSLLSFRVNCLNSICLFDVNRLSEDVYCDVLNAIFGYNLRNANLKSKNKKAIDLVDDASSPKLIVQISSRRQKKKVQESLNKIDVCKYGGYHFIFISLVKNPPEWKQGDFHVPNGIVFNPTDDVMGPESIIEHCNSLHLPELKKVYEACKMHFHGQDICANNVTLSHVSQFISIMAETSKFESMIRGYCIEVMDGCGSWEMDRRSRIFNLLKNQLADCFTEVSIAMIGFRRQLLCDHVLLSKVRLLEDLHTRIHCEASTEIKELKVDRINDLIGAEMKLVNQILDIFSARVGIDKVDLYSEYIAAMQI